MIASVTISVEIELAWGWHDIGRYRKLSADGSEERDALARFLAACDRHGIPITFNVVGHLLHDRCAGSHPGPHRDGWFDADPGTDLETDPLFYGPDLVEMIRDSDVDHEICTHTYSHVICNEIDNETLRWELTEARKIHESAGLETPTSLVPPRHGPPDRDVLNDCNIKTVRVGKPTPYHTNKKRAMRRLYMWFLDRGHPTFDPSIREGIIETYTPPYPSLTAFHLPNGERDPYRVFQSVPASIRRRTHKRYLRSGVRRAMRRDSNAHYSTHLQNLAHEQQLSVVTDFLAHLGDVPDDRLTIARMKDLGALIESEKQ